MCSRRLSALSETLSPTKIVGRFAPSPTGPMHFGSLLAAVASFLDARAAGGYWRLRIDDLDTPRVVPDCDRLFMATLKHFGLHWDAPVMYQSSRRDAHRQAVADLLTTGQGFVCGCTRAESQGGPMGLEGPMYPGTCRDRGLHDVAGRSVRAKVPHDLFGVSDRVLGEYTQNLGRDVGDFVVRRRDRIASYQLATVVDDAAQGITDVVRGADLLTSAPRQAWLRQALGLPAVSSAHIPLIKTSTGGKLGKSTGATALSTREPGRQIWRCLELLGQQPPNRLRHSSPKPVLEWAIDHWNLATVPRRSVVLPEA